MDISAEESAARLQLITAAAEKLKATMPTDGASNVRLYFSGGDPLDECCILKSDDTSTLSGLRLMVARGASRMLKVHRLVA